MRTNKTTKLLALTLSLLMLFTMIPLSVSAEGQTILDVAQNDGNGNYYLESDVTVTEMVTDEFTGTFDGKGFTITTTVPLFQSVKGATIENFVTAETNIKGMSTVAKYVLGNTVFRNIINNTSVDGSKTDDQNFDMVGDYSESVTSNDTVVGGIAGCIIDSASDGTTVLFENCINKAEMKILTATKNTSVGGILGAALFYTSYGNQANAKKVDIVFIDCRNEGKITSISNAGGILGQAYEAKSVSLFDCSNSGKIEYSDLGKVLAAGGCVGYTTASVVLTNCYNEAVGEVKSSDIGAGIIGRAKGGATITNCVNYAKVFAKKHGAGILAYNDSSCTIKYCGNEGDIETIGESTDKPRAAGIHASAGDVQIMYCYNTATIKSIRDGAGISSNMTKDTSVLIGCYNSGEITGGGTCLRQLNCGNKFKTREDNYYTGNEGVIVYTAQGDWEAETLDGATEFEAADLSSGKLAYDMNKAIGAQVYYQNIGSDTYPVLDSTHGHVFNTGNSQYSSLRFHTLETASVRLNEDGVSGLRFSTAVNKEDYTALEAAGITLDFGTIITPDEYLQAADNSFTALESEKYIDVNSTAVGKDNFITLKGESDDYYYFCGSITGIKEDNYDWDYSAIGYVTIGEDTVYSSQYATRSIAYVANAAYKDRSTVTDDFYNNDVSETEYAIEGKPYSPYTKEQLATIKEYL